MVAIETVRTAIEEICEHQFVYLRDGALVYETAIEKQHPLINLAVLLKATEEMCENRGYYDNEEFQGEEIEEIVQIYCRRHNEFQGIKERG